MSGGSSASARRSPRRRAAAPVRSGWRRRPGGPRAELRGPSRRTRPSVRRRGPADRQRSGSAAAETRRDCLSCARVLWFREGGVNPPGVRVFGCPRRRSLSKSAGFRIFPVAIQRAPGRRNILARRFPAPDRPHRPAPSGPKGRAGSEAAGPFRGPRPRPWPGSRTAA